MSAVATRRVGLKAGWRLVSLGEICSKPQYGWTTKATSQSSTFRLLRTTDITSGQIDWKKVPYCTEPPPDTDKYLVREGDILISRAGSVGVSHLVTVVEPSVFASYLIRFRSGPDVLPKYLAYFLKSQAYWKQIADNTAGIAIPNVNASKLQELRIPLAPIEEQHRIVNEIEEQFSRLDEAVAFLGRVKANLRHYKATVLKAAVEGRLVPIEAELARQVGRTYESGAELLRRIVDTRCSRRRSMGKYEEPVGPEIAGLPQLPEGWAWALIGQAFDVYVGATPSRARAEYWNGEIPWVSSGEVAFCRIKETREKITEDGFRNSSTNLHPPGTVLLGMIGEGKTRGQAAILEIKACNNQNSAAIRVSETDVLPEYVYSFLEKEYEETRRRGSGGNQPALNKQRVREIPVPLPPVAEQRRIVEELARQLSLLDATTAAAGAALVRAHRMREAALATAFAL